MLFGVFERAVVYMRRIIGSTLHEGANAALAGTLNPPLSPAPTLVAFRLSRGFYEAFWRPYNITSGFQGKLEVTF